MTTTETETTTAPSAPAGVEEAAALHRDLADGIAAAFMGLGRALTAAEELSKSGHNIGQALDFMLGRASAVRAADQAHDRHLAGCPAAAVLDAQEEQ